MYGGWGSGVEVRGCVCDGGSSGWVNCKARGCV